MSTLKIILYKSKTLSNGEHPVRMRLYYGKERYLSLGYSCTEDQWNSKSGRFNKKMPNHQEKNSVLRQKEAKADKIIQEMVLKDKPFSFHEFKNKFENRVETVTVHDFVEIRIKELKSEGAIGNMNKYRQLRNTLKKFKGKDFIFSDVNYKFLKEFESYILGRGCKKTTVYFYMRTLRASFNEAIRRGYLDKELYPFDTQFNTYGYSLSHLKGETSPKPMTLDEIEKFKRFPVQDYPRLENTYDLFLFLMKARGINFVDLCELTLDNIVGDRLNYVRQKTGKLYSIKLSPELREIINKYKGNKYLFPILDTASTIRTARYHHTRKALKIFNDQLSEISEIIGTANKITSYTARYSYTNVLVKNNVPVPIIQQALGHSSIATTQYYIQKFSNEEVDKVDALI